MSNEPLSLENLISITEGDMPAEMYESIPDDQSDDTSTQDNIPDDTSGQDVNDTPPDNTPPDDIPPQEPQTLDEPNPDDTEPPTGESQETPTENDQIKNYYNFLKENNYLSVPEDFEFDGSPEKFQEALDQSRDNTYKEMMDALWNSLDEEGRDYVKYRLNGGKSLSEYIKMTQADEISDLDSVSLQTVPDQKKVVKQHLKLTTKLDPSKIDKLVDQMEVSGQLTEEAQEAKESLKTYYSQRKQEILTQTDEEKRQYRKTLEQAINDNELISDDRKNKVRSFMINEVTKQDGVQTEFQRKVNQLSANPEHLAVLADILYDSYDPQKGFDLTRFEKKGGTKTVSSFQKKLENSLGHTSRKGGTPPNPSSKNNVDWERFINVLE